MSGRSKWESGTFYLSGVLQSLKSEPNSQFFACFVCHSVQQLDPQQLESSSLSPPALIVTKECPLVDEQPSQQMNP